jgi:hypothetical protein
VKKWKIIVAFGIFILVWATTPRWMHCLIPSWYTNEIFEAHGKFGSSFTVFNSLFTGLAFLTAIISILMQLRDKEKSSRNKVADDVESRFFKMLSFHYDIIRDMEHSRTRNGFVANARGRNTFQILREYLAESILWSSENVIDSVEKIKRIYTNFYQANSNQVVVGHYFRNLYQIYKFIDTSNIDEGKKMDLAKLLRAQLGLNELVILFFNGVSVLGENFKPLIEKYHVLSDFPTNPFDGITIEKEKIYSLSAFNDKL